ncbi:MAG: HAMP domain-containing sensor histidine kinase [Patescibacteria group bacterium]
MKEQKKTQIILKYIILYVALASVLGFIFTVVFYTSFSRYSFRTIQDHARTTAEAIAEVADFSGHDQLISSSQKNSETFQRIFSALNFAAAVQPDVEYIYTMRQRVNGEWEFVVDATIEEDENQNGIIDVDEASAEIGEEYDVSCCPELPLALFGATADREITHDIWGSWISGYAPIHNSDGQVIGIIGVDISAEVMVQQNILLRELIIITLVIIFVFTFIFGMIGYAMVSKEDKRVTQALKIKNEELERKVVIRTKSLEQFMATLVHDLRSPLTGLRYSVEILLEENGLKKAVKDSLHDMGEMVQGMLGLVGDLLDATKYHAKQQPPKKTKNDLIRLTSKLVKVFGLQAKGKGLLLRMDTSEKEMIFNFDQDQINRLLMNLISNAVKYTDEGSIIVKVEKLMAKKRVRVEVVDTGAGIKATDLELLFQPFSRVGSEKKSGTGLGLMIAKGIVSGHNGEIGVESKLGKGSTFWFELPI